MHCNKITQLLLAHFFFYLTLFSSKAQVSAHSKILSEESTFTNPVLNINFADPTVIKASDGYYYAYATQERHKGKSINIQAAKSKDLVEWEYIGEVLPVKPDWADTSSFWAPHVDERENKYYMYFSAQLEGKKGFCIGAAIATSPSGPFKPVQQPIVCGTSFINIDPMAFDDPKTGKTYLYWGSGHEPLKVQELDKSRVSFAKGSQMVRIIDTINVWKADNYQKLVEGPWVIFREGYYYIFYSGDNCCGKNAHYAVMVARSKSPTGPFETMAEATGQGNSVILELNDKWKAPGHNSIVTDNAGKDWIVYHAIPAEDESKERVMLIDRIIYKNGWPSIASGTPSTTPQRKPGKN